LAQKTTGRHGTFLECAITASASSQKPKLACSRLSRGSTDTRAKGTGWPVYVRRIVEKLGGQLALKPLGPGSIFFFTLPSA